MSPRERSRRNAAWSSSTVSGAMPSSRSTRRSAAVASTSLSASCASSRTMPRRSQIDSQAMVLGERLEQPERVERARHSGGAVVDAGARERVLEHRAGRTAALCATNTAPSSSSSSSRAISPKRGARGDVLVADPVHRGRLGRDRTRGANEPREPARLDAVRVEPHDGERDDLVHVRRRPGRLAVEHRVRDRRRHVCPPRTSRCATDIGRNGHAPTMSRAAGRRSYARRAVDARRAARVPIRACTCSSWTSRGSSPSGASSRSAASPLRDRDWRDAARPLAGDARRARLAVRPRGQVARHPHRRGAARARGRDRRRARPLARPLLRDAARHRARR